MRPEGEVKGSRIVKAPWQNLGAAPRPAAAGACTSRETARSKEGLVRGRGGAHVDFEGAVAEGGPDLGAGRDQPLQVHTQAPGIVECHVGVQHARVLCPVSVQLRGVRNRLDDKTNQPRGGGGGGPRQGEASPKRSPLDSLCP